MDQRPRGHRNTTFMKKPAPLEYNSPVMHRKVEIPEDFAEKALEIESWIDRGEFTTDDISELMLLYSQAVEYYNSVSSHKSSYYTERIQMALMKPGVHEKMQQSTLDPEKTAEENKTIMKRREQEKLMNNRDKVKRYNL